MAETNIKDKIVTLEELKKVDDHNLVKDFSELDDVPNGESFSGDDLIAIEIDGVNYKLTGAALAAALKTLGGYVSKSGDTMTGPLTITNNSYITKVNPAVDVSTNPSSTQFYVGTALVDKNNKRSAVVEGMQDTNGRNVLRLFAYGYDTNGNQNIANGLSVIANRDGTIDYALPNPANFRKAIAAPESGDGGTFNLDDVRYPSMLYCSNGTASGFSNALYGGVITIANSSGENAGNRCVQIFIDIWSDAMFVRRYTGTEWTAWKSVTLT